MASREYRRMKERKVDGEKTQVEKRKEKHPIFYWITFVILMFVVIAFIGSGIVGGIPRSQASFVFGKYGKHSIEVIRGRNSALSYFAKEIDDYAPQMEQSPDQVRIFWREAFNNTLSHYAIVDLVEKSGFVVSKKSLDTNITNLPEFYTDGRFDDAKYAKTTDMDKFLLKNLISELIIHNHYMNDVFFSRLISTKEIEFYKNMVGTERRFSYGTFRYSDFPDEKVVQFGKDNTKLFKLMRLSRILLTDVTVNEAESVRNQIENKTKSFEDMAKEKSKDIYTEKGGDMGNQYYYQIKGFLANEQDVDAIFALRKDELSPVIKNGENYEIYRCNSPVIVPDFADPEFVKTIRDYMLRYEKVVIEKYCLDLATTFKNKADETGFEKAWKEVSKASLSETEFFPINYLEVFSTKPVRGKGDDSASLISASGSEEFFTTCFALQKDGVSNPVSLDDQIVVLKMLEEKVLTESDWEMENIMFTTSLQYFQSDFAMTQLVSRIYMISQKHDLYYQYLLSQLVREAEKKKIPYDYMFKVFINLNIDLDTMIEELKKGKVVDNFDKMFTTLHGSGI